MSVLVKVIHTALAEGRDPRVEVWQRLLNYRNTPHPSTGKTPAELLMNRRLRTKVPSVRFPAQGRVHQEAQIKDKETQAARKKVFDKRKRAQVNVILPGDNVLIKQQKTTVDPPFDPKPYKVTKVKNTQMTAERNGK